VGFGAGVSKLQRWHFDEIRAHEASALGRRAPALRSNDQRKLAFQHTHSYRYSNVLLCGLPSLHPYFPNNEFHATVQSAMGAPLSLIKHSIGLPIKEEYLGMVQNRQIWGIGIFDVEERG